MCGSVGEVGGFFLLVGLRRGECGLGIVGGGGSGVVWCGVL